MDPYGQHHHQQTVGGAASLDALASTNTGMLAQTNSQQELQGTMEHIMAEIKDPNFNVVLDDTLNHLMAGETDPSAGYATTGAGAASAAAAQLFSSLAGTGVEGSENLAKTLEMLQRIGMVEADGGQQQQQQQGGNSSNGDTSGGGGAGSGGATGGFGMPTFGSIPGEAAFSAETMTDEMLARMMDEFEKMGNKDDFNSSLDAMMRQLLAKDVMYIPAKQITEKFPEWLARHKPKITQEEYENYGRQYRIYQHMTAIYETDPDNFPRLLELLQDIQELGNPPDEIIRELAPGLEISPDGIPILPNMGPGVPQLPTIPGAGCCIM